MYISISYKYATSFVIVYRVHAVLLENLNRIISDGWSFQHQTMEQPADKKNTIIISVKLTKKVHRVQHS